MSKLKKPITLQTTFSSYTATEILGEGGAGRVYLATDDEMSQFAIKILNPARATKESLKRFKNEVLFGQRNTHKNIVTIIDNGVLVGAEGKREPFYVMPAYSSSLRSVVAAGLPHTEVMTLFLPILDGVEAAHFQGIFHRDLKMENILYDEGGKRPVVADFGIAHFEQEDLYTAVETRNESRLANFQYAAPEQRRRGATVDRRADIYALGLLLNEMFTGEVPAGTGYRTIESVAADYGYLDSIVEQMIRQTPDDRIQTIDGIKREIDAHGHETISYQAPAPLNVPANMSPSTDAMVKAEVSGLPNSMTLQAAVSLVKRYIVDERHRIQLTELFRQETENAYQKMGLEAFPTRPTSFDICDRIMSYDQATTMLATILITGCHWGTEQHHRLWTRLLERIAHPQETDGGVVSLLDLRRYPAFRLAFAAGIAAIEAGRYDTLYAILAGTKVAGRNRDERQPLPVAVYYQSVVQHPEVLFPMFNGARRKAPLADHLFDSLRPLFLDLVPRDEEYEALYEKMEYLWALFHLSLGNDRDWVPMGRLVYKWRDSSNYGGVKEISDEIAAAKSEWPLLKAGLLNGSYEELQQKKQTVDQFMTVVSDRHW